MHRFLLLAAFFIAACDEKKPKVVAAKIATPIEKTAATPADEALDIFNVRCSVCHGARGKGDGAAAAALSPKPRDLTDAAWQKSVTDDHLRKVIVEGGAAVGKSPLMAANPDLKDKPDVVTALVKHVRSLGP